MNVVINKLIARMQQENNFPAISRHITEISCKASPTGDSSANELATAILRDYSLTSRLLKVANSAMYGQFSGNISTVSRAVVVLGFEQVQLTAAGLIFFESLQDRLSSHYIKEAVLSSFLSGIIARDLAKNLRLPGGENFYIGAMFHNFGRLLAMNYFSEEFKTCQRLISEEIPEEQAARRALGVTFEELGVGVARFWSLPDQIIISMKRPDEKALEAPSKKANHQQILPALANEICHITLNVAPEERRQKLLALLARFRKLYALPLKEVTTLVDAAVKEMKQISDILHFTPEEIERLEQKSFNAETTPFKGSASLHPQNKTRALNRFAIAENESPQGRLGLEDRKQHLQNGIQDITNCMLDDFTLDEILGKILETIYRGIGFNRVVIFFKDLQTGRMQARYGLGPNAKNIVKNVDFKIEPEAGDLFNMSLKENRDLYIGNIADVEIRDYKPEWFAGEIFSPSFIVLPIVINKREIGLIYGGHDQPGEHLTQEQLNSLKTLRNQAALAIKQVFSG